MVRVAPGQFARRALGQRVTLDGHTFDSFGEARRYEELKLLLKAGAIEWLKVHPRYVLEVNGIEVTTYVADFAYTERASGAKIVEDYKGFTERVRWKMVNGKPRKVRQTNPDWKLARLKIALLEALLGVKVKILERGR